VHHPPYQQSVTGSLCRPRGGKDGFLVMKFFAKSGPPRFSPRWGRWAALLVVIVGSSGAIGYVAWRSAGGDAPPGATAPSGDGPEDRSVVRMAEERWPAAGIRVEPAAYTGFTERVWRGGHLALDETRLAHLSPMVEGVVREVKVRLGQDVRAGEVLVVLDSREVGQAKLDLVKARLAAEYARAQHTWTQTTSRAARELVEAMAGGATVPDIEKRFKDRPIGELRQQLITAYSRWLQAKAHYEAVSQADVRGSVSPASVIRLRADFEAAEAAFRALCEEAKFQTSQNVRASEQKLREAQTAEALSKATLMMLGYSQEEVGAMDPIAEGPRVSLYSVRAPFAGTVIKQHAVLAERVDPEVQMFQIADLSTLWLQADVPQKDVPLARRMAGGKVRFRVSEESGALYEGDVFYTGDLVDRDSRAVVLTAAVPNPGRKFKPGMFVEVELTRPGDPAVQVPARAIQWQGTQPFVFVHEGGDAFRRVDVKVGRTSDGVVEVTEGLSQGQAVVVDGGFVLKSELLKDQMVGD
jgi:cobalt-zinc-cadmium efflux system membrane fusion protein